MDPGERAPFSAEIRRLRRERGESQVQVSSHTGVAQAVLSRLETGERLPTDHQLALLAAHYGTGADELRRRASTQRMRQQQGSWPWEPAGVPAAEPKTSSDGRWIYEDGITEKRQSRLDELEELCADAFASIGRLVSYAQHSPDPVIRGRAAAMLSQLRKLGKLPR